MLATLEARGEQAKLRKSYGLDNEELGFAVGERTSLAAAVDSTRAAFNLSRQ